MTESLSAGKDIDPKIVAFAEDTIFYILTSITDFSHGDRVGKCESEAKDLRSFVKEIATKFEGYFGQKETRKSIATIIELRSKNVTDITDDDGDVLHDMECDIFGTFFGSFPIFAGLSGNGHDDAHATLVPKVIEVYNNLLENVKSAAKQ